ncbi:hypothetical protein ACS0TY_024837 [Phlomoides rotata]
MEQFDFDSIITRVRHLRENIAELQRNYDQLTLNIKVSGNVQLANLNIIQTSIHGVKFPNQERQILPTQVLLLRKRFIKVNHYKDSRGEELEIKFITAASEDMTKLIQYPSFHFMKLQRPNQRVFTYIKAQETKPKLVVNLTEDEVSTRRAWGVWVYLTEMEKVKYPFKIYRISINGSLLLNSMTGTTTRFANDMFEQKKGNDLGK